MTGLAPVVALGGPFPAGRVADVEGRGHYPWVEQPEASRAAVDVLVAACR